MDSNNDQYKQLLIGYDKLEKLVKVSQLIEYAFRTPVLNEYRYFSRALVDYGKASSKDRKDEAISRARVALSAAYNDVIDSIIHHIKSTVQDIKNKYWNAEIGKHLKDLGYKEVLEAFDCADKMIATSRENREDRFDQYVTFAESPSYETLINFAFRLGQLEFMCELDGKSHRERNRLQIQYVKSALKNKETDGGSKFELFLQSKHDALYDSLTGVEALIRLRLDSERVLTPDQFLNLAFNAHLEEDIGNWVLDEAVRILSDWKDKGFLMRPFDFAINIAPSQAGNDRFAKLLDKKVKDSDIEDYLSIEITEDWIHEAGQYKDVSYRLGQLNDKTRVAIDDFGTGTTRIEYLALDHLSSIKIDKSLVDALLSKNGHNARKLIKGIVSLAKDNNLKVTAEGVEKNEQKKLLCEVGVNYLQGYIFSRPMPVCTFENEYLIPMQNLHK